MTVDLCRSQTLISGFQEDVPDRPENGEGCHKENSVQRILGDIPLQEIRQIIDNVECKGHGYAPAVHLLLADGQQHTQGRYDHLQEDGEQVKGAHINNSNNN